MALQILSSPPDEAGTAAKLRAAIEEEIPGARVTVTPMAPGHFEIEVVSEVFEGLARVQQQQRVYRAITPLMTGSAPPVHAVDRMLTRVA